VADVEAVARSGSVRVAEPWIRPRTHPTGRCPRR
jgi:hypothetical protein